MFWNGKTAIEGLLGSGSEEPTIGVVVGEVSALIRYALLAEIGKAQGQLCSDMISNGSGDANPARLRKSLQPSRDVYGIAK
jgi:hypothetical protein